MPRALVATITLSLLAAPSLASADAFELHDPATGIEASRTFTHNAQFCRSGTSCSGNGPLDGSFGLQIHAGYRIVPFLSAGLHLGYQVLALDSSVGGSGAGDALGFGAYARVHPLALLARRSDDPIGRADLFVGVDFDFYANVSGWSSSGSIHGSFSNTGFAFPFSVGIDFAVHENVDIGVIGMAAPWTVSTSCGTFGIGGLTGSGCRSDGYDSEVYFFIGAGVRAHFHVL